MNNIIEDIKNNFSSGNSLTKLIYINVGVFLLSQLLYVFPLLFSLPFLTITDYFSLPANTSILAKNPWSIITYMFLHENLLHLFFNLLCLYFGGKIFLSFFDNKKIISTYVLGGISGAILYMIAFNIFPVFEPIFSKAKLSGASASVLAIVTAIATKSPNYSVRLFLIENIKLKYIAILMIFLSPLLIPQDRDLDPVINILGSFFAHLGGAFFGYLYVKQLNSGNDIASSFNRIMDYLTSMLRSTPKLKKAYSRKKSDQDFRKEKMQEQAKIDNILDKIAKSGYDGLTKQEKDILFKASKK